MQVLFGCVDDLDVLQLCQSLEKPQTVILFSMLNLVLFLVFFSAFSET